MLNTKNDYFALSRQQGMPSRCPLVARCERRAHTLAIANNWDFNEAPARLEMKGPLVVSVGEPAYLAGGENNFIIGGQCPEVGLFESTMAIIGLSGTPLTKGRYDKYMHPQYEVLETGHFSECAEYVRSCYGTNASPTESTGVSSQLTLPEKVTLKWLFNHVPIAHIIGAVSILCATFFMGLQASRFEVIRAAFDLPPVQQQSVAPPTKRSVSMSSSPNVKSRNIIWTYWIGLKKLRVPTAMSGQIATAFLFLDGRHSYI